MRAHQFLNEYDRNKTATPLSKQILQNFANNESIDDPALKNEHGTFDQPKVLNYIMSAIEASDPTPNKLYTPWLTREYAKGRIRRLEDLTSRLTPLMKIHFANKNKRDFPSALKDIMRISAKEFEDGMSEFKPPEPVKVDRGNSKVHLDTDDFRIIIPKDKTAACYYGQGTKWCTAATHGDNYFDAYNAKGPLYIVIPKHPAHTGEKYQLHFTNPPQFMDEQDVPVSADTLKKRFPTLPSFFKGQAFDAKIFDWFVPTEEEQAQFFESCMNSIAKIWDNYLTKQSNELAYKIMSYEMQEFHLSNSKISNILELLREGLVENGEVLVDNILNSIKQDYNANQLYNSSSDDLKRYLHENFRRQAIKWVNEYTELPEYFEEIARTQYDDDYADMMSEAVAYGFLDTLTSTIHTLVPELAIKFYNRMQ